MGAVADGARENDGRTVGVIPKKLVHRELADVNAAELIVTDTMRERKQIMEDRSDAFIALPGGIGTTRGLQGFVDYHQLPFRIAFPNRRGGNHGCRYLGGRPDADGSG